MTLSNAPSDALEQLSIPDPTTPATGKARAVEQPKMTTRELEEALHAHFIKPEDRLSEAGAGAVYLTEVTAPNTNRRADAVYLGLWQSRGAGDIDVCELKTSRSDFRRELEQPAKAEAWWPYCTRFWIVSPGEDVTPPEELPPGWGLMVPKPRARRFRVVVKPAEREPKLTMPLLLTLLKDTETTRVNALRQQRYKLQEEHYSAMQQLRRELAAASDPEVRKRLERLDDLEAAMGMPLDFETWYGSISPMDAAAGLREFMQGRAALAEVKRDMQYRAAELERSAKAISDQARVLFKALSANPQSEVA